jgi:hypothetical protein
MLSLTRNVNAIRRPSARFVGEGRTPSPRCAQGPAELLTSLARLGLEVRGTATSWAALSPCARYRYALGRAWGNRPSDAPCAVFVLHNPSTADDAASDPTLRRCLAFARRACRAVVVVNAFALRATDKKRLLTARDPVGRQNDTCIGLAMQHARIVVVGWGRIDAPLAARAERFAALVAQTGQKLHCLGVNTDGSPKHPLYIKQKTPLRVWRPASPLVVLSDDMPNVLRA